jgi:hypothetical protein
MVFESCCSWTCFSYSPPGFLAFTSQARFSWLFQVFFSSVPCGLVFLGWFFKFSGCALYFLGSGSVFLGCQVFGFCGFGSVWPFPFFFFSFPQFSMAWSCGILVFWGFQLYSRRSFTWLVTSTKSWGLTSPVTQAKRHPHRMGEGRVSGLYLEFVFLT